MKFEHASIHAPGSAGIESPPRATIRALVADILADGGQTEAFGDDDTLAEIGIGSVDMVTLLLAVESTFNLEVPQHEITIDVFRSISTLDAMVRRLQSFRPPAHEAPAAPLALLPTVSLHVQMNRALYDNVGI